MSDLQSSIQRMHEQLAPALAGIEKIHNIIDRSYPPGLLAVVRNQQYIMEKTQSPAVLALLHGRNDMLERIHSPAMLQILKTQDVLMKAAMPVGMMQILASDPFRLKQADWFSQLGAISSTMQRTFGRLNSVDLSTYDFDVDVDDEIEATEYELISGPELEIPEKRIILLDEVSRVEQLISAIYKDNNQLYQIHSREFEKVIAELLRSRGFEVHLTKQTRDGGKDIIALQKIGGISFQMLVECKKHALRNKVDVDIIRSFGYVVSTRNANKGIICTTSYFTADAKKEQQNHMPLLLELKDRNEILDWVNHYAK